jgi:hypothetical protein
LADRLADERPRAATHDAACRRFRLSPCGLGWLGSRCDDVHRRAR